MKKLSIVICLLFLSVFLTGTAFAQMKNTSAYFLLDNNLTTAGYQGLKDVKGAVNIVGGGAKVGFAIYAKKWDESTGIKVAFEWDGTKAGYIKDESGLSVASKDITINGSAIKLASEDNIISNTLFTIPEAEKSETGLYENSYVLFGGAASKKAEGLIFFAVFKTLDTFTTLEDMTIGASVNVIDAQGTELPLGTRYFYVNRSNDPTDVKPATWKEVKEQFKDF